MDALGIRAVPALAIVVAVLLAVIAVLSVKAFAGPAPAPIFGTTPVASGATFAVPPGSGATFTLRLFSQGRLLDKSSGTSGTLSVSLPAATGCGLQADVRKSRPNGATFYFAGSRTTTMCCPPPAASSAPSVSPFASS